MTPVTPPLHAPITFTAAPGDDGDAGDDLVLLPAQAAAEGGGVNAGPAHRALHVLSGHHFLFLQMTSFAGGWGQS